VDSQYHHSPCQGHHRLVCNTIVKYLVAFVVYCLCIDHATELRNARARIRDLEAAAAAQRAEVTKL